MNSIKRIGRHLAACAALLLAAGAAHAQTTQGQIAGNVLDATGAVVPNATITAKGESTGVTLNAVSTSAGAYRFPSIALGRYTLTTTAAGFKQSVNTGVEVRVGTVTSLDLTLSTGGNTETVTVQSDAPTVQSESSDVGGTVTTRQIIDLPLALGGVGALRSPEAFVFLVPGTTGPGSANNSANGIFINKLGGGQAFGNEILLDGASVVRSENGSSFDETGPSVEAISEFKVTTSTPQAEFGRTTGGIENFVFKSGTNSLHGTAFDIFRNEALDANNWFANGYKAFYQSQNDPTEANYNRQSDKQNDYGVSLGGPVVIPHLYNGRDKTFFFFSWEQFRRTLGGTATSTVPTVAERSGDLSDQLIGGPTGQTNPCDGTPIQFGEIFDPLTTRTVNGVRCRDPFRDASGRLNQIPVSRFSTVAQRLLAFYPPPTNSNLTGNFSYISSSPRIETPYNIRIDHSFGDRDKIFGSYASRDNTRRSPQNATLPGVVDPDTQVQDFITHYGRAGWDHTFTLNVLNHLNLGFNRTNSINGSIQALSGVNYAQQLGIANIQTGFPRINVGGIGSATIGGDVSLSRNQNDDNIDNGIRVNDSVSWQRGRNSFKFGGEWRYQQYSALAQGLTNGVFNFLGNQTSAVQGGGTGAGTGLGLASFLLGNFDSAGTTIPSHQPRWISNYYAGFVQDDFKATKNLLLNLGFRYDVDQPRKEATNSTSNFTPTAIDPRSGVPGALVFGTTCNCNTRWADTWYKDFGPRVGFAYTPPNSNGKTVLRGGYALLYGPLQYSDFGGDTIAGYTNPIAQNTNGFDIGASNGAGLPGGGIAYSIDDGLQPYTVGTNLDPGLFDNGNSAAPRFLGNTIRPSFGRPGAVNQWSLQVQQEVAKDLIATIGYIGNSGAHLKSQEENINNTDPSTFGLGDTLTQRFATVAAANGTALPYATFNPQAAYFQALRPFPQYDFIATDCCLQNVGHSSYHALITSVERRFSQGLALTASYTWSKTITNADSIINVTSGVQQEQNPNNSKLQKSLSNQDIPHTFVTSFLYELPFGKNQRFLSGGNVVLRALVSGFQVGGVLRYQSGIPESFGGASGIPGFQNHINFTRIAGSSFASNARRSGRIDPFRELRGGGSLGGPDPNVDSEFNGIANATGVNPGYSQFQTAPAFYDQNETSNRATRAVRRGTGALDDNGGFLFGNVPRVVSEVRNYPFKNEDFSLIKATPFGEGKSVTFKVELLNGFNRHIFATPNLNPGDRFFGVPAINAPGTGGRGSGVLSDPRAIQLTARVSF